MFALRQLEHGVRLSHRICVSVNKTGLPGRERTYFSRAALVALNTL